MIVLGIILLRRDIIILDKTKISVTLKPMIIAFSKVVVMAREEHSPSIKPNIGPSFNILFICFTPILFVFYDTMYSINEQMKASIVNTKIDFIFSFFMLSYPL